MARAYKKTYLYGAMRNLAVMLDCGVRKYGYTIEEFYDKFLASDVSRQFAKGNPRFLVGLSGAELADSVVEASGGMVLEENDGTYTRNSHNFITIYIIETAPPVLDCCHYP